MKAAMSLVEAAVIEAYCAATGVDPKTAAEGFAGGGSTPFDSIVGLELIVAMEIRFGAPIDEAEETKRDNFASLKAFTEMVERYVGAADRRKGPR